MTKEDLVEGILDTLDDLPLEALRALADGLKGAEGALGLFYLPIYYTASDRERGVERGFLAPGSMSVALTMGSQRREKFIKRLDRAESAFWVAVREALIELAEDEQPATVV